MHLVFGDGFSEMIKKENSHDFGKSQLNLCLRNQFWTVSSAVLSQVTRMVLEEIDHDVPIEKISKPDVE